MRLEKAAQIFLAQFDQVIETNERCAPDGQAHVTMMSEGIKAEGHQAKPFAIEAEAVVEWLKHAMEFAKGKNILFLRQPPILDKIFDYGDMRRPDWSPPSDPKLLGYSVYSRIACCYGSQGK